MFVVLSSVVGMLKPSVDSLVGLGRMTCLRSMCLLPMVVGTLVSSVVGQVGLGLETCLRFGEDFAVNMGLRDVRFVYLVESSCSLGTDLTFQR